MLQILSINGPFGAIIVFSECSNLLFEDSISQGKESGPDTRTGCYRNAESTPQELLSLLGSCNVSCKDSFFFTLGGVFFLGDKNRIKIFF